MEPRFFRTPAQFRKWLERHHARETEIWIGMYRVSSGKKGITYKEALDEALCFGWIDGVRKRLDDESYVQRFTPRKPKSYWSAVNTRRVEGLKREGRMHAAGLAAFDRRDGAATEKYSFERKAAELYPSQLARFRAEAKAWKYFESEAPWYRRVVVHWVTSAKKEETRERRLATLIDDCAKGRRIGLLPARRRSTDE